jgi:hypothetical protein
MTQFSLKFSKIQDDDQDFGVPDLRRIACRAHDDNSASLLFDRSGRKSVADGIAINCNSEGQVLQGLSTTIRDFVSNSIAENTKRAYAADLAHYAASGRFIPSLPQAVAEYIADHAGKTHRRNAPAPLGVSVKGP